MASITRRARSASEEVRGLADGVADVARRRPRDPHRILRRPLAAAPRRLRFALLVLRTAAVRFFVHHGLSWSAAIAFYLVLSIPPLLIAVATLGSWIVGEASVRGLVVDQVGQLLPAQKEVLEQVVRGAAGLSGVSALGTIVLLLVLGSRVLGALIEAIGVMWRHADDSTFLERQAIRTALLIGVGTLIGLSVVARYLVADGDGTILAGSMWLVGRFVIPTVLVGAGLFITYRLVPGRVASWRAALAGAVVAAVALRAAQAAYTWYVSALADFTTVYGSLASIAILLSWALVASVIVLYGAEVVAAVDRRRIPEERSGNR